MLIVISCTLLLGSAFASAHDSGEKDTNNKYYKCIEVAPGETLWTIADRYASTEYDSYQEYINEVIQINQMDCSTLYADQKLIIPYYAEAILCRGTLRRYLYSICAYAIAFCRILYK